MTTDNQWDCDWVARTTFFDPTATWWPSIDAGGMFYEAGGVYDHHFEDSRPLMPGEQEATCPGCGQQFAATDEATAETNRDLHFYGRDDCPSICRHFTVRRDSGAVKGGLTR